MGSSLEWLFYSKPNKIFLSFGQVRLNHKFNSNPVFSLIIFPYEKYDQFINMHFRVYCC